MRVLIAGAQGQLGRELLAAAPAGLEVLGCDSAALNLCGDDLEAKLQLQAPDLIINAAAYTAVDRAESEPALADAVNAQGVGRMARWCAQQKVRLLHVSTDFVFDGRSSRPYAPDDRPAPVGVYGASKWKGELAYLAAGVEGAIVRTAWVYSRFGNNFVKTMLRLMRERESLGVVADQVGTPTWAAGLAALLWRLAQPASPEGVMHWSDAGVASWYDFALAIQEEALALGLLAREIPIKPLRTEDYPTPAQRPAYSVLDKTATWAATGIEGVHWRLQLRNMLQDLKEHGE